MGVLNNIRHLIPYCVKPLHEGFKYLGYFIKPLGYEVKDWLWILKRFEKRIRNWSFKFLSLGGRLVLIWVVLTNLPIYWFALALIPVSILNKIRQLIFSFLWGSSKNKICFHLVDWQTLARPFNSGGWGIKNLAWVSISLRLRSLWWVLKGTGIWHQVISTKYLKQQSMAAWLRNKKFGLRGSSIIWNGFLKTITWLGRCLSWKVGDGRDILIG